MPTWTHAQDARTGRVDVVVDRLAAAIGLPSFTRVDAAVAYASLGGVELLLDRARASRSWGSAQLRFLISIDSGFTEPEALARLAAVPGAEVRVPNAEVVLKRADLRPARPFHPKAYLIHSNTFEAAAAMISGSANLTISALSTGAEVITDRHWPTRSPRSGTAGYSEFLAWFDDAWCLASPLVDVLGKYRVARSRLRGSIPKAEDEDTAASAYSPRSPSVAIRGADAARLAVAKTLWIEGGTLSRNLGPRVPGNQLDTPRGTRVFFGFAPDTVPKNHMFGEIELRIGAGAYSRHSVRFGNNSMDKINLPVPGGSGAATYDGRVLLFDRDPSARDGTARFTLSLPSTRGLAGRKSRAGMSINRVMNSGRAWGLLF